MNRDTIQRLIKEHGVAGFGQVFRTALNGEKLPNGAVVKLDRNDLSFKELWEATVGSVRETFDNPMWNREAGALDPTGFPTATENILSTEMIAGYTNQGGVADILVPNTRRPRTPTERIQGLTSMDTSKSIVTGEEYPTVSFGEKFVTFEEAIHQRKEGYEIQVTEEVIRWDQTGNILDAARQIGDSLATEKERRTIRAIHGIGADSGTTQYGVYFPSGTSAALYTAAQLNLRTNATPIVGSDSVLADYTDLDEVNQVHSSNITDDRQIGAPRPIVWTPDTILVPPRLAVRAGNILASVGVQYITDTTSNIAPQIRNNVPNPLSLIYRNGMPTVIPSIYSGEISNTAWIVYDRNKTFLRIEVFPFQTFRAPVGYGWNRDVVFAMRAREWSRVIAKDFRHAIKSDGA